MNLSVCKTYIICIDTYVYSTVLFEKYIHDILQQIHDSSLYLEQLFRNLI